MARKPSKPAILLFMWLSSRAKGAREALPFMAWWKDRSAGAGEKRGMVTTLGESPDRGSGCSVSGPHEWPPPEEGILRDRRASFGGQARNYRTMKKSEKNRAGR